MRDVPSGTVGGRIALTPNPARLQFARDVQGHLVAAEHDRNDVGGARAAIEARERPALRAVRGDSLRDDRAPHPPRAIATAARICPAIYGGIAVLKMNVRARLIR